MMNKIKMRLKKRLRQLLKPSRILQLPAASPWSATISSVVRPKPGAVRLHRSALK